MLKNMSTRYDASHFKKTLHAVKRNPLLLLYVVLLDAGFFVVFYLMNLLLNTFLPDNPEIASVVSSQSLFFIVMLLISIMYFLIIILAYSFFNLVILGNIRKMAHDYTHDLSLFKNMFLLNLVLFLMFFVLLSIFNYLTALLVNKPIWLAAVAGIVALILLIFAYAFHNFSHSAFILGHRLKTTLRHALKNTFSKAYLGIITFSIVFMVIYFGVYMLLGLLIGNLIVQNLESYINTSSIVTLIVAYIVFTLNRIYFFFVAEKRIGAA